MRDELPGWVGPVVLVATLLLATAAETLLPLRPRVEPRGRRFVRNSAVGALSFAVTATVHVFALGELTRVVGERRWGLLNAVPLPNWLGLAAGFLLLDWTLWVWHVLNHRVPFLWRFHLVHHVDLDLDASTGLRFHFGEITLSLGFRVAQLVLLGPSVLAVQVWQSLLFASVFFHHSNTRLPFGLERRLVHVVVTPRMHGIHHSVVREERDSNFASLLTLWDHLHGTMRLNVPQRAIRIGVPPHSEEPGLRLAAALMLPFRSLRRDRELSVRDRAPPDSRRRLAR